MSGVGEASSNFSGSAEIKTRGSGTIGSSHLEDSVGARGRGLAVTIEQREVVKFVASHFDSGIGRSAGADSSNSVEPTSVVGAGLDFDNSGKRSSVASCTLTLEHTSSRNITTATTNAPPAAVSAQPFGLGIEVVFESYGQRLPHSNHSRSYPGTGCCFDRMRSRRTPGLKSGSTLPPKESDKLLAIKSKAEERRADNANKRAPSSNRKKTIEPQMMPINSACNKKPSRSYEANTLKESTQTETAFNQLLQINETLSPEVEIATLDNADAVELKMPKARKPFTRKLSKRSSAASRKAKSNKKAKNNSAAKLATKGSSLKLSAEVIDSSMILREKFYFLTESQLENLRILKILSPENLLNLSLRQLNSIGINKGKHLEAILSILDNGKKCKEQNENLQNSQIHQQQESPHDASKDNDDDEEQALVIDETATACQEIENITCSPDLDLSLRTSVSDEDPIKFSNAIDEVEKSLILIKNSSAPNAEKKIKIESILNELNVIEEQYRNMTSQSDNNSNNDINEDKPPQPLLPLKEGKPQKKFTFNLPTATSIFKLTDGQIIKDVKSSNLDQSKPRHDDVKKMTLRSKSKSAESQPPQEKQISTIQFTKKETKESKNKLTAVCNPNVQSVPKNNRLNIITNPAAVILMNSQESRDCSTSKTVRKVVKYLRNGINGFPIQVAKPIEFVDVVKDGTSLKTANIQMNPSIGDTTSNIVPLIAADFLNNPSPIVTVTQPKNIVFINANKPYSKNDVSSTLPNCAVTLNTCAEPLKFITPVTEENVAKYATKLNFNLGEIRRNLVVNTLPIQNESNQFDSSPKLNTTTKSECTQSLSCTENSPDYITSSKNHYEEQLINPPEAFRFYSSQESSPNSLSTTTRTIRDEDKSSDEYQHAFNTFVHTEFNKKLSRRDSDSASSRSSDKIDLLNSRIFHSSWLLPPTSHSITKNSNTTTTDGAAKVISNEIIVAAPLGATKKFDIAASTVAASTTPLPLPTAAPISPASVSQEPDLHDYSNQLHCKTLKQELGVSTINLASVKLEKCTDKADSTTKSLQLIYKDTHSKRKDNPFNKPSTTIRPILGGHLLRIKQELSEDADSTTRSPELTSNQENTTMRNKKERRVKEKFRETDNQHKEHKAPIQSKERKIKLKRNFHIKRKDQSDAPQSQSPTKRYKYASLTSQQWLYSHTQSSSNKLCHRSNKKLDKLADDPCASLNQKQQLQERSSAGYSSSTSSSRVVYTHPKPSIDAAAARGRPLTPSTHSSQSISNSFSVSMVMQQNERNASRHQIPNWQTKSDLRQKLENRRANISSQKIPNQYQNEACQQHRQYVTPPQQKALYVQPVVIKKSYDQKEEENYYKALPVKAEEVDNKNNLHHSISHNAIDCKSDNGVDSLTIASPTFSALPSVETASPASPKNSLSYYTSAPEIDGQMTYPPMLYMLSEIVIPKEVNEPPSSLLQIKTQDPRLSKYIKKNTVSNYSDSTISPARNDPRLRRSVQFSDAPMPQQQQQQMLFHKQQQQQQQQQQQPQPNMVLYNCLQRSSWYQGLMSTMKIQINQCISELVRALNNFQKERQVDHTAVFDIFKIDCACELMEIMRSLCIRIDMNGVITDQKNFFAPSGCSIGFGGVAGIRTSLVPTTAIKSTYSFVQPELPSSAGRMVAPLPLPPPSPSPPPQSPMRHSSPFVSRYLESPPHLPIMPPVASRPRNFESRRQCGFKAPYMSRPPPHQWRDSFYDRPPQNRGERSYERAPPPQQYRELSHERATSQKMIDSSNSCSNEEVEEECWD